MTSRLNVACMSLFFLRERAIALRTAVEMGSSIALSC